MIRFSNKRLVLIHVVNAEEELGSLGAGGRKWNKYKECLILRFTQGFWKYITGKTTLRTFYNVCKNVF